MKTSGALLSTLAMLGVALGGCADSSDAGGSDAIRVENLGPEGGPGPYQFTAKVDSSDGTYRWDLGDRLTVLEGETVTHKYDFANSQGNLTITLTVRDAEGKPQKHAVGLRIGSGTNESPAYVMEAETNWAVVGETIRFSAARSVDAEGDPIRYSWACNVLETDAQLLRKAPHPHSVAAYTPPRQGSVTSYLANTTLPPAELTFQGDLCEALGNGTAPSTGAATIAGSFAKRGKYMLILKVSDGAHPFVSGSYDFYVTSPAERPEPWVRQRFVTTLEAGKDGRLQGVCAQLPQPQVCDHAVSPSFELPLAGLYGWLNVTYDARPAGGTGTNLVDWALYRGESLQVTGQEPSGTRELNPNHLLNGSYSLQATLRQGAKVNVTMSADIRLNLDPFVVY